MTYSIQHIAAIIGARTAHLPQADIEHIVIDSRKIVFPQPSVFFAINGPRRDGHLFIDEVYERGVRFFVVSKMPAAKEYSDAFFLLVEDVLIALQKLAAFHRSRFSIPVIGITGSNGKTIVKEWLFQLLQDDFTIVRSPRSYNSQVGVPLSLWQMDEQYTLGIFEAGISTMNEMAALANMIQPTIGVFTNLAEAHSEGFADNRTKALEKIKLFQQVGILVYAKDQVMAAIDPEGTDKNLFPHSIQFFSWSRTTNARLQIIDEIIHLGHTTLIASCDGTKMEIDILFTDRISIDNAITCWAVLLALQTDPFLIQKRMKLLASIDMRMQLKNGIHQCKVLNDSYSNDTFSLNLAIDYLLQQAGEQATTVILSDILQSGIQESVLYRDIAGSLKKRGISRLIGIGPAISRNRTFFLANELDDTFPLTSLFFPNTNAFMEQVGAINFSHEFILLKGARIFEFEKIAHWLEQKVHQTQLEINLSAVTNNLKAFQGQLSVTTKLMAMVKAFGYGSGSAEISRLLQFHKVDYLAVAYADEGVELRKAGISLPIMVLNVDVAAFDTLVTYQLEPEIYSFAIFDAFHEYLKSQGVQMFPVHIKFNTGMNRLGFETADVDSLALATHSRQTMVIRSVFSHLVASESTVHDGFTAEQVKLFTKACDTLQLIIGYPFLRHIANTAAIQRNPAYQFDMVRLGIGLYGVDTKGFNPLLLETAVSLTTTIAQIRQVKAGETVGYGRAGFLNRDSTIATIRIGYADGYSRHLGNGKGKVWVRNQLAPVIGNICMDMTMIDITDIPDVKESDIVEIFGKNLPIQLLANWAGTIPYEIMTGISQRVKRIYIAE